MRLYVVLLVICTILKTTKGDWILEVQLQNYSNPYTALYNKDKGQYCCCERCMINNNFEIFCASTLDDLNCTCNGIPGDPCDNIFTFCVKTNGDTQCITSDTDEYYHVNNIEFSHYTAQSVNGEDQNVYDILRFSGSSYPSNGEIEFLITIHDTDFGGGDSFLDEINIKWDFQITSFSDTLEYVSIWEIVRFTLDYRLYCTQNYYGQQCDVYCIEQNSAQGYYVCDANGEKVCMSGYTNPDTNCTEELEGVSKSSCQALQISTGILSLLIVFLCGGFCAVVGALAISRRSNSNRKPNFNSSIAMSGSITNQSYTSSQQNTDLMSNPVYNDERFEKAHGDKEPDEYETMTSRYNIKPGMSMRKDFSPLPLPTDPTGGITHTYEKIVYDEFGSEKDNKNTLGDEKLEEYAKLRY